MLLNDISTNSLSGGPIKSPGMFYIKAMQGNKAVQLQYGQQITIKQPLNGLSIDENMKALILAQDSAAAGWIQPPAKKDSILWKKQDTLTWTTSDYIYTMYQFITSSWYNSDNPVHFSSYPQTTLTLQPLDTINVYNTYVFVLLSTVNAMVHVYGNGTNFPYYYAPSGLECTVVAIGVKKGKVYSSFTPITITNNLTVNFSLSETTAKEFKAKLKALN